MGRINTLVAAIVFASISSACFAQSGKLSDISASLSGLRDNCASQAEKAKMTFSTGMYQNSLDSELAAARAQADARVYSVGHGSREATEYLAEQLQSRQADVDAERQKISDKLASDRQLVSQCVDDAEQHGKAEYSAFKASHKRKADLADAESLVTAWIANLKEITTDVPQGSDATSAAWKTAKAHAEIADL